jgi:guanine deaminase
MTRGRDFGRTTLVRAFSAMHRFIDRVIELAVASVRDNGGPFAALVVRDGEIVAEGVNRVTSANDPTAHAEIVAIREACRKLGAFQLTGCDVYASCEPCPMCLGALYWARPARVIFAATRSDAAAAGFDDELVYEQISLPHGNRSLPMVRVEAPGARAPFRAWEAKLDKTRY